ncbi:YcxB family protein [Roseimicrobium sp. ORNL1]|uniref:YcxB family protein n=1 Tax=Roseimicrobium sp. ORNL1 TaxID=2711231 RepID=UPI0013E11E50|nr:YcxB family protein [Roseimicrobium sp. ORNL1]QIF02563.1 YcxB family protein [Roseimicrobium sp. ORNL1]
MTITSDITASDLRALYWRVMLPERLRLGFAISLPGFVMWLCLAGARGPEFILVLQYFGMLCSWLFVALSFSFLWTYLASRKQWESWMQAAGKYTYEWADRQLTVTEAGGRREFPTHTIKSVEDTPEHVFIIMRKGPHYVIARSSLTADEEEAVRSFREAVAFASLHVDMLHKNQMPREEAISKFNAARWLAVGFALVLPFTLGVGGWLPVRSMVTASLCAVVVLSSALGSWRGRQRTFLVVIFAVWILGPSIAGVREESFRSDWYLQWLCLTGLLSTLPLLIFSRFFRRLGKLDEAEVA